MILKLLAGIEMVARPVTFDIVANEAAVTFVFAIPEIKIPPPKTKLVFLFFFSNKIGLIRFGLRR